MAFTVHLKPSDHEFIVAHGETILEAALRFGFSVKCSCTNGTCGTCKARVISGDVGNVKHFDYVFGAAEKGDDMILMCRTEPASDMVIEATEVTDVKDIPDQQLMAKVSRLEQVSDHVMILELRTPRSQTLQFMAGQHVTLAIDGAPLRNKSIASCPCNGMVMQFHIHKTPDDEFADFIFSGLNMKQQVEISGPYGRFVLDEDSERPIIFIAYETGFAPIKSLIEHAIALEMEQSMRLYWIVDWHREHYQGNYSRSWQDALDDFQFIPIVMDKGSSDVEGAAIAEPEKGLLQAVQAVVADYPDLSDYDVYMNGPVEATLTATQLLLQHKLPQGRLFIDQLSRF